MSVPPSINSQTILRSRVHLPGDEQAKEPKQAPPADTETEAEGQQPPLRDGLEASSSSSVPLNSF